MPAEKHGENVVRGELNYVRSTMLDAAYKPIYVKSFSYLINTTLDFCRPVYRCKGPSADRYTRGWIVIGNDTQCLSKEGPCVMLAWQNSSQCMTVLWNTFQLVIDEHAVRPFAICSAQSTCKAKNKSLHYSELQHTCHTLLNMLTLLCHGLVSSRN